MSAKRIYIYGPQGSGKTTLAEIIGRGLISQGDAPARLEDFRANREGMAALRAYCRQATHVIVTFVDPAKLQLLPKAWQVIEVKKGGQK